MTLSNGIKKSTVRKSMIILTSAALVVGVIGWLGIQVRPKPFTQFTQAGAIEKTVSLPDGLPGPVERFYTIIYGREIPVIESVVILGRGTLKPFLNIPIPARFIFIHTAGKDYRHYFEATFFGIPVLRVNEGYIDGKSFFENPMVTIADDPNTNQAANLTLWAEAMWFPALWITDPRVHWEPVDANTALLFVPFEKGQENILVRFNPQTGLIDTMETMRYRDPGEDQSKILWILRNEQRQPLVEGDLRSVGSAMWLDQGSPWAYFNAEEIILNTDVSNTVHKTGYPTEP